MQPPAAPDHVQPAQRVLRALQDQLGLRLPLEKDALLWERIEDELVDGFHLRRLPAAVLPGQPAAAGVIRAAAHGREERPARQHSGLLRPALGVVVGALVVALGRGLPLQPRHLGRAQGARRVGVAAGPDGGLGVAQRQVSPGGGRRGRWTHHVKLHASGGWVSRCTARASAPAVGLGLHYGYARAD